MSIWAGALRLNFPDGNVSIRLKHSRPDTQKPTRRSSAQTSTLTMTPQSVLTVNGGSSTIKLAVFGGADLRERRLKAQVERRGDGSATLTLLMGNQSSPLKQDLGHLDERAAATALIEAIHRNEPDFAPAAIAH